MSSSDVLVVGSGIAGLMVALRAAGRGTVTIVSKRSAEDSNTNWAQGGIAAVFERGDSFSSHRRDTLRCGVGLCDPEVVRRVVEEAPARVEELGRLGVPFTREGPGYALGREGGHSHRRIVHATDFTGAAIERALLERVREHPNIALLEDRLAVDLILESRMGRRRGRGRRDACWGAYVMDRGTRRIAPITARVTVMASGGSGKVYLYTTNPDVATGDGLAMAFRAGLPVADLEFVQFHPTCLFHPRDRSFLLTEALRGEGAVLRTIGGERFMPRYDRRAELAPRDVVARAIDREMKKRGEPHVFLDITERPARQVRARFPNIVERLAGLGFDLTRDWIPVVPAAHYMCGGVVADLSGTTALDGLLAVGEVARTGLHGANRLASNSLLEALVAAHHAGEAVAERLARTGSPPRAEAWRTRGTRPALEGVVFDHNWDAVRRAMWDLVGIVRSDQRLEAARRHIGLLAEEIEADYDALQLGPDLIELRNVAQVGMLIVEAARQRRESRGLHQTLDHPRRRTDWDGKGLVLRRDRAGRIRSRLAAIHGARL